MELVRINLDNLTKIKEPIIATIGQFDGIHLAHMALIKKTQELARSKNLKSAVFTFDPHPDFILKREIVNTYITPLNDKKAILENLAIDYLIIIEFNQEIANMSPKDFVNNILVANMVKEVVVGFDFSFGKGGIGKPSDISTLTDGKIIAHIVDEIKYKDEKMGSSLVKSLLKQGDVLDVKNILGRFYKIKGIVVKGNQVGRTLNIPTANLKVNQEFSKLLPGVYVVLVTYQNQKYLGIANLGNNPSFNLASEMLLEVHIFDFEEDIYNKMIEVEFVDYIRKEIIFATKDAFILQIAKDKAYAKKIANDYNLLIN